MTMEKIVGRDVLLFYPNFSVDFVIQTHARKNHLWGIISQNGNHVVFYSRKLSSQQINFTNTE